MRRLEERVAVITGAASGIGRATSEALARKGCDLALSDVDMEGLEGTAERVRALGRKASVHRVDVSSADQMAAFPEAVIAAHGHAHILMNNAGVTVGGTFEEQTLEDLEWIVGINFWGVVYGCKFFLPYLRREEEAHIVNLSSMFGLIGLPTQTSYCATKFAVRALSEGLWSELADTNIGVTSVHPGGIRTNIVRGSRGADEARRKEAIDWFEQKTRPPEYAAARIVSAIEKGKRRQLICPETHVTDVLKRLLPVATHRLVDRIYRRHAQPFF